MYIFLLYINKYFNFTNKVFLNIISEIYYNNFYNDLEFHLNLIIDHYTKEGVKLIAYIIKLAEEREMSSEEFEKNILKLNS